MHYPSPPHFTRRPHRGSFPFRSFLPPGPPKSKVFHESLFPSPSEPAAYQLHTGSLAMWKPVRRRTAFFAMVCLRVDAFIAPQGMGFSFLPFQYPGYFFIGFERPRSHPAQTETCRLWSSLLFWLLTLPNFSRV